MTQPFQATINPVTGADQLMRMGIPFEEVPVFEPIPWLPVAKDIAWGLSDRVVTLTNGVINTQVSTPLGFDFYTVAYALSAAVRNTAGNALPGSFGSPLDSFRVQFVTTGNYNFQTADAMGSALVGTAAFPRKLGRCCWRFNGGAQLRVLITPLMANLQVDVIVWTVQTTIGSNIAPAQGGGG